jgi:hypothetical protein
METSVSHPLALASATRYSSFQSAILSEDKDGKGQGTYLADLVAAVCEARVTVLPLGVDVYFAAELGGEVWEVGDWGWTKLGT